jgi:glycine/D-amino acid oxidase-like deaminating enzyme
MDKPGYADYMAEKPDLGKYQDIIRKPFGFGEVQQAFQVDLSVFLHSFRSKYAKHMVYGHFEHDQMRVTEDDIFYQGLKAKNVIFSEGYKVIHNPYFNYLPFQPVKGEILLVKIKGSTPLKILRDKMFICPVGKDLYWVGSGYEWKNLDEVTTTLHKEKMMHFLDNILTVPYEIIDHKAGVRPSTKDRRPILGQHPNHRRVFIFNGLGTKGTSLSPYWSKKMMEFMKETYLLPREVDLKRFH